MLGKTGHHEQYVLAVKTWPPKNIRNKSSAETSPEVNISNKHQLDKIIAQNSPCCVTNLVSNHITDLSNKRNQIMTCSQCNNWQTTLFCRITSWAATCLHLSRIISTITYLLTCLMICTENWQNKWCRYDRCGSSSLLKGSGWNFSTPHMQYFTLMHMGSSTPSPPLDNIELWWFCLKVKRQYYQNCSLLDCVTVFTVSSTLIWAVLTGLTDRVCHFGTEVVA